jgi:hypothetical protein
MIKHVADASGPAVIIAWIVDKFIPVASPIVLFTVGLAGLAWYGIRFYEYFKNGRLGD